MEPKPVLYLDLDDTILSWAGGSPAAAPGASAFLLWALESFEVRWLTRWCPSGRMGRRLGQDLCRMLQIETDLIRSIRGLDWRATASKLDGIAWMEHVVLDRPFLWVEDEYGFGEAERRFLDAHGFLSRYRHCNVTEDRESLRRLHGSLKGGTV